MSAEEVQSLHVTQASVEAASCGDIFHYMSLQSKLR